METRALCDGARFGLLLQLAVGPVCLYVLRTATDRGVWPGLQAVAGVTLVDALFITLAGLGVTRWAEKARVRRALRLGGAVIIAIFAVDIVAAAVGVPLVPGLELGIPWNDSGILPAAVLLTASNPLTIVFWAGVFGAKVAAEQFGKTEVFFFSCGCLLSTVVFLTAVVVGGSLLGRTLPVSALAWMNVAVGCALLYFAARLAIRGAPGE